MTKPMTDENIDRLLRAMREAIRNGQVSVTFNKAENNKPEGA